MPKPWKLPKTTVPPIPAANPKKFPSVFSTEGNFHDAAGRRHASPRFPLHRVGAARSRPLVRSTLGSLSEGAVSPNGLTEGVWYVIPIF